MKVRFSVNFHMEDEMIQKTFIILIDYVHYLTYWDYTLDIIHSDNFHYLKGIDTKHKVSIFLRIHLDCFSGNWQIFIDEIIMINSLSII